MTSPTKYAVVSPSGRKYLELWHESHQLHMQLLANANQPTVALDIKALPQMIEALVDIYNELHPSANIGKAPETVVEGFDAPATKTGVEAW